MWKSARSCLSVSNVKLQVAGLPRTVTVEAGGDLLENDSTFHTDIARPVRQASAGERVVVAEFAGDPGDAGHRRRFQRAVPRTRRPRGEFFFRGRPAHHRPAEQSVFQPDSARFHSIDGSDRRRAAGRIWRQDQRGHQCDHALRPGSDYAARQRHHLLRERSAPRTGLQSALMGARTGETSLPSGAEHAAAFSIRRNSR